MRAEIRPVLMKMNGVRDVTVDLPRERVIAHSTRSKPTGPRFATTRFEKRPTSPARFRIRTSNAQSRILCIRRERWAFSFILLPPFVLRQAKKCPEGPELIRGNHPDDAAIWKKLLQDRQCDSVIRISERRQKHAEFAM